jgi:hypothetical protein
MSQDFAPMGSDMQAKKTNVWLIVGIVVAVILILTCCCIAIFAFGPVLLGPAIGNVFENIVEGLE